MQMQLLNAVIAALPMPVMLIGPTERIEAVNPAAAQLFISDGIGRH